MVPAVAWPSRYPEVIAVGAGTIQCAPWSPTSPGTRIDVLAPGKDVWNAFPLRRLSRPEGAPDGMDWVVRPGEGSSFATPFVAGVAALWIQYFGYESLVVRYGKEGLADAFRAMIRRGGRMAYPSLDPRRYGTGFIDAAALLDERSLPSMEEVEAARRAAARGWSGSTAAL